MPTSPPMRPNAMSPIAAGPCCSPPRPWRWPTSIRPPPRRLRSELVPAAAIAAQLLFRQNDLRKGAKLLEANWKIEPHPEVGELYVHARPGDATQDRLTRARKLQALKQN